MARAIDLTGQRFGRLVVQSRVGSAPQSGNAEWLCFCDCGKSTTVNSRRLRGGITTSCGCYSTELLVARSLKHGMRNTRTYRSWTSMRQRCLNPRATGYEYYGGRGIEITVAWGLFENFLSDMGERPASTTLDRINVDGNYEPGNCRWASNLEQVRNMRISRRLTHDGLTMTLTEWAERTGLSYGVLYDRLRSGWSAANALMAPFHREKSRSAAA